MHNLFDMSAHVKHVNLNSINNTNIHLHFIYVSHPLLSMLFRLRGTTITIGMLFYIHSLIEVEDQLTGIRDIKV